MLSWFLTWISANLASNNLTKSPGGWQDVYNHDHHTFLTKGLGICDHPKDHIFVEAVSSSLSKTNCFLLTIDNVGEKLILINFGTE